MWTAPVITRELIVIHVATRTVWMMRKRHDPMNEAMPSASVSPKVASSWWTTLTGCTWLLALALRRWRESLTASWPESLVRTDIPAGKPNELFDDQRHRKRPGPEHHDHRGPHDEQADEILGEVGHAVERDGRVR